MKLSAKHLLNTDLSKTVTHFTLKIELGVVSLEATLNTERMAPDLFTDTLSLVTESGFMNSELFPEWLQNFAHVRPTKDDPVLFILDSQVSHCTLAAVVFRRKNLLYTFILATPRKPQTAILRRGIFWSSESSVLARSR
jgi:hypothetical protein